MKLEIKNGFTTLENAGFSSEGNMISFNPGINGILISYGEQIDEEGKRWLKPYVSTLCVDANLSDHLNDAAHTLLGRIPTIELQPNNKDTDK